MKIWKYIAFYAVWDKTKKTKIGFKMKKIYGFKRKRAMRCSTKNLSKKNFDSGNAAGGSVA